MKIRTKKSKNATQLELLSRDFVRAQKALYEHESKYSSVYERRTRLLDRLEELQVQIKDLAREQVVEGETIKLVDGPEVSVQVASYYSPVTYNPKVAKKFWPPEIYARVARVVIDPKEVARLVEDGEIGRRQVERAEEDRELRTPAVTIKFKHKNSEE